MGFKIRVIGTFFIVSILMCPHLRAYAGVDACLKNLKDILSFHKNSSNKRDAEAIEALKTLILKYSFQSQSRRFSQADVDERIEYKRNYGGFVDKYLKSLNPITHTTDEQFYLVANSFPAVGVTSEEQVKATLDKLGIQNYQRLDLITLGINKILLRLIH